MTSSLFLEFIQEEFYRKENYELALQGKTYTNLHIQLIGIFKVFNFENGQETYFLVIWKIRNPEFTCSSCTLENTNLYYDLQFIGVFKVFNFEDGQETYFSVICWTKPEIQNALVVGMEYRVRILETCASARHLVVTMAMVVIYFWHCRCCRRNFCCLEWCTITRNPQNRSIGLNEKSKKLISDSQCWGCVMKRVTKSLSHNVSEIVFRNRSTWNVSLYPDTLYNVIIHKYMLF